MAPLKLEVPVFSPGSAQVALARAGRIELNRAGSYPKGGLTPELSDVQSLSAVPVPLRISKQFLDTIHFKAPATGVLYLRAPGRAAAFETGHGHPILISNRHS